MPSLIRHGEDGYGVAGDPWGVERVVRYGREGMVMRVGGELRGTQGGYLADGGLVVWMGNEDLELVRGGGEVRRRYLDFLGMQLDAGYRRAWSRYRRALRAKNALLKEGRPRDAEIVSYEEVMVEHGRVLMEVRARMVADLAEAAAVYQRGISGRDEVLGLQYLSGGGEDLREAMGRAREREVRLRQAVVGPHRDDLGLRLQGVPAVEFASEGQQRTLALAMKLAQGAVLERRTGRVPVYLIDDVFGELDPGRRNALMQLLPGGAQKWVTTTHLDWLEESPQLAGLARMTVAGGGIAGV